MKFRATLCGLAAVFLSGCTTPIAPGAATTVRALAGAGPSQITVTRDSGLFGSACSMHIAVDGVEVGKLDPGEKLSYRVQAGQHQIGASNSQICGGAQQYMIVITNAGIESQLSVGSSSGQAIIIRQGANTPIR